MKEILEIAEHLKKVDTSRKKVCGALREIKGLALPVKKAELNGLKICGVDGGFLKKEYHGINLILRRAVAVCFSYSNGKLEKVDYLPDRNPSPEPLLIGAEINEVDFSCLANLRRVEMEIKTAISAVKEFNPDMLVMDGSIVVYPANIPEKSSSAYPLYKEVVELYKELYEMCKDRLLVGAIEDSKGKRYCNLLAEQKPELKDSPCLKNATDTLMLYYLLNKGERTQHFSYSSADIPVLKDIGDWGKQIYAMYIKAVEFDRPLRIDFLSNKNVGETAERVAQIIQAISCQNRSYSYPSVLIEADARAKLKEREISLFKSAISEKLGHNPSLFELRRELRPF